jgi:hypothetical protein
LKSLASSITSPASNPDFSTLVTAVKAAGLADTLSGAGPYTVFAPTNEAFAALPAGTLGTLLKPENEATLAGILTYHVVAGSVYAKDVKPGSVMTVNGAKFTVSVDNGSVFIRRQRRQGQDRHDRHRCVEWCHPRHQRGPAPLTGWARPASKETGQPLSLKSPMAPWGRRSTAEPMAAGAARAGSMNAVASRVVVSKERQMRRRECRRDEEQHYERYQRS